MHQLKELIGRKSEMLNLTDVALTQTSYSFNKQYFGHPAGLDTAIWNMFWKEMYTENKVVPFLSKKIEGFTNIFPNVKIIDVVKT